MSSFGIASSNPWVLVLDALEKKVNRTSYETWFKPTRYDHAQGPILFVRVPNPEFCHIGERYGDLISEAIENLGLEFRGVEFVTEDEPSKSKSNRSGDEHLDSSPATEKSVSGPITQQRFDWDGAAQLNPKYTFDDFVIGAGNQFAHAASRAVAERPSKAYNPLFLYGGVGMGKTHLMQAIGHEIKKRWPEKSICYVSSERFTNDMINALRYSKMTGFRDKYR
ncbi:MAG: DnaA/Hda family protein, partial [Candidatus Pacebacteria bacterium]|nr:DnaA/Hda family protein [Candidatus Paceibacterota bacterium]